MSNTEIANEAFEAKAYYNQFLNQLTESEVDVIKRMIEDALERKSEYIDSQVKQG